MFFFYKSNKTQQKIILDKWINNEKFTSFIKYLKNFLSKIDYSLYNYEEIFKLNNKDLNSKWTEKIYLTNNICESVNGKINYYLPKKSTNNLDFVTWINKL